MRTLLVFTYYYEAIDVLQRWGHHTDMKSAWYGRVRRSLQRGSLASVVASHCLTCASFLHGAQAEPGREVYRKASQGVFLITTRSASGEPSGQGTGFLVRGRRIVTNYHVVAGETAFVDLGSVKLPTTVDRLDQANDLAVLTVGAEITAEPLPLATQLPSPGETVYALGNPRGLERSISVGVLSAVRTVGTRRLIQISAPISPGSSGGPILNRQGEVVGVAVGTLPDAQNLNFAIPVTVLSELLASAANARSSAASVMQEIETLREQQSTIGYSLDEGSQWQKLETRIRTLWREALDLAGNDIATLERISQSANTEDLDTAIAAAERVIKVRPNANARLILAKHLTLKARWVDEDPERIALLTRAESSARAAVQGMKEPTAEAIYALADLLEDRGKTTDANTSFRQALEVSRREKSSEVETDSLRGLVRTAYALERPAEGEGWFNALAKTGKATAWDWSSQADRLSGQGKDDDAARAYHTAASTGGMWTNWCSAATSYSYVKGREDFVLQTARRCIELGANKKDSEKNLFWAHINVAEVLDGRGVHEESLSHAREAIALDSSSPWAYHMQAGALYGLRRFQETVNAAKQAIRLSDGKYGGMHFRLASAYFAIENWEGARQSFEKAAELSPSDDAAAYNVALCMVRLGFYADAARWYQEVLRRRPEHPDRQDLLRSIERLRR